MQLVKQEILLSKGLIANHFTSQKIEQELKNFKNASTPNKQIEYNALKDKYAFGYFQNQSVQRHLKKMLKVLPSQNSLQNIKKLPPSSENRKVIGTLSEKILKTHENNGPQSLPVTTQRVVIERGNNNSFKSVIQLKDLSKKKIDAFYPYKENLKLKSLQKLQQVIQKKEKLLIKAEQKGVSLPRLQTLPNEQNQHEKTMQRLIERQDRILAGKMMIVNKLKHKEFSKFLKGKQQRIPYDYSKIKSKSQI